MTRPGHTSSIAHGHVGVGGELRAPAPSSLGVSEGNVEVGLADRVLHVDHLLGHYGVGEGHKAETPGGKNGVLNKAHSLY